MVETSKQNSISRGQLAIVTIAIASLAWYLFRLGASDVLTDEVLIGFRSIGYLDFFFSEYQTTPLEWFASDPPWWTMLWFHDHPPLSFLLQHISFLIFGPTAFALRFPSALAAAVSIFLAGSIARMKWGNVAGIVAALGLAVLTGHVSMARQGLQEAILTAFLLLSFYAAVRAQIGSPPQKHVLNGVEGGENKRGGVGWWYVMVVTWGLAFLTKLTAVGLIPALLFLAWRGSARIHKYHRAGIAAVAVLFVMPMMVYNALLFRATGHLDFQFSYLFGQNVPQWQERPGREYFSDFSSRLISFFPNTAGNASVPLNAAALLALGAAVWQAVRRRSDELVHALLITIASFSLLFLATGPLPWFTYMLWPWFILLIAQAAVSYTRPMVQKIIWGLMGIIFIVEFLVAWNTVYRVNPLGKEGITHLSLWRAHAQWGYQELEKEMGEYLHGLYSGGTFPVRYPFLEEIRDAHIRRAKAQGLKPATLLLVYDTTMHQNALLWTFFRRTVYEGWSVLDVDTYRNLQEQEGKDEFWSQGFEKILFVRVDPDSGILFRADELRTEGGMLLEQELGANGIQPTRVITSSKTGKEAIRIYELKSD